MVWQITLGDMVQLAGIAVTVVSAYYAIKSQLNAFKTTLDAHAATLATHSARMDRYESRILDLVASLQRLVGQSEMRWKSGKSD